MTITRKAVTAAVLGLALVSGAMAAEQAGATPDQASVRTTHVGLPNGRVAPLAIGSGTGLTLFDSFAYNDWYPATDPWAFTTSWYWCNNLDNLKLLGAFYTPSARLMTATIKITSMTGAVEYNKVYSVQPLAGYVQWMEEPQDPGPPDPSVYLPTLPAGLHKVAFKFKQGDKIVGQTYWIAMSDASSAECAIALGAPAAGARGK